MRHLSIDIETYSSADLGETGVYAYAEAPDFEILLLAYAWHDEAEVHVMDLTQKEDPDPEVLGALTDPAVVKHAYNAAFEIACLSRWMNRRLDPAQWRDTMVTALMLGLPRSLADVGIALGLPEDKMKDPKGKQLIRYFCKPCPPTRANGGRLRNLPGHDPAKWALFIEYNRQDVVTEMEIQRRLSRYPTDPREQDLWVIDQEINGRGVRIDVPMVRQIVSYDERRKQQLQDEARRITGLANPNSLIQLKGWLARQGVPVDTLRKDDLDRMVGQDLPRDVPRVLEIRRALGKASTAKYQAMLDAVNIDGRLRGTLQFYGASRSGRWAGRIVQTHNLARNSLPDLDLARQLVCAGDFDTLETLYGEPAFIFSELVRTAFIPSDGCSFLVADYSAIEARVLAWLAGEGWVLDAFRAGKDIYCETASKMYHVPVVKHGENGHLRQKGKVAVLACGYQGGVGAMRRMDSSGSIPEEELQSVVDQWRDANPHIVKLWRLVEQAARLAIEERRAVRVPGGRLTVSYTGGNLWIRLPSGRQLCYWETRLRDDPVTGREQIIYKAMNTARQWADEETYGGKLVENITQATARDCLAETIRRVSAEGFRVVMHVHDEIIVDGLPEDYPTIVEMMSQPMPWAPGLPLSADGYVCQYYKKD